MTTFTLQDLHEAIDYCAGRECASIAEWAVVCAEALNKLEQLAELAVEPSSRFA